MGLLWAALVVAASAADLAEVGERLAEAEVVRVEEHPEYRRYHLRYPSGVVIPAELGRADPEHVGLCLKDGFTVFPRLDLADGEVPERWTPPMDALCERLVARGPPGAVGAGPATGVPWLEARTGVGAAAVAWGLARGVLLAGVLVVLADLVWHRWGVRSAIERRARAAGEEPELAASVPARLVVAARELGLVLLAWVVTGPLLPWFITAWLARYLLAPVGLFNGANAGYEKMLLALGLERSPYGAGFPALFGLLGAETPGEVFALNRIISALAVPTLWLVVFEAENRLAEQTRRPSDALPGPSPTLAASAAALGLLLLPAHIRVAASELMHGPLLTLSLLALYGVLLTRRPGPSALAGALLGATAGGLALHIRPDAAVLIPVLALAAGRAPLAWLSTAFVALQLGYRSLDDAMGQQVLHATPFLDLSVLGALVPRLAPVDGGATQLVLVLSRTPIVIPLLGLVGLAGPGRWLPLGWIACFTIPFLSKSWPEADLLRLQLAAQVGWLWLVGRAIARGAWRSRMGRRGSGSDGLWLGLAVTMLPWLGTARIQWANQEEWHFLEENVARLPAGATVLYDGETARAAKLAALMERLGPARWAPIPGEVHDALVFRGVDCHAAPEGRCAELFARCTTEPERVEIVDGAADLDLRLPDRVEIGFYRVRCGPRASEAGG